MHGVFLLLLSRALLFAIQKSDFILTLMRRTFRATKLSAYPSANNWNAVFDMNICTNLGKYKRTTSPSLPWMWYEHVVFGGYQWAMLKNMPSDALESFSASDVRIQSQAPIRLPTVSTCPGQLPTLKWKPVFNNGPAGEDTNSTNMCCDVPALWITVIASDLIFAGIKLLPKIFQSRSQRAAKKQWNKQKKCKEHQV